MTIPFWPKATLRGGGGKPISQFIWEQENVKGRDLSNANRRIRSWLYRNGEPLKCIQCGASCGPKGEAPVCGH